MASKPYPDKRRGTWKLKYRPVPTGPWIAITLGKDPRLRSSRPPKTPPPDIAAKAAEFADVEYRARYQLSAVRPQSTDFAGYRDGYLAIYAEGHDEGSLALARRYLGEFVAWCAGRGVTSLQGVSDALCRDFLEHRRRTAAATTLRMIRSYIAALFARAVQDRLILVNPWLLAPAPRKVKQKKKPRFWTPEEVGRIVAACRLEWHRDLVLALAHTGIRISAMLAMEWDWVVWRERKITVPAQWNKGGTEYDVILSDFAHDLLARRFRDHGGKYVFAGPRGRPHAYSTARNTIQRAIRVSGVPKGTPHDLRHTFGRSLHLGGVPQSVISAMLGHSSIRTTEIYTKMDRADAIAFMRRLSFDPKSGGTSSPPASDPSG